MHQLAEAGVAAHWLYKTKDADVTELQQKTNQWLKRMLEIQIEQFFRVFRTFKSRFIS